MKQYNDQQLAKSPSNERASPKKPAFVVKKEDY
jgi:hypothetical protein